MAVGSTVAAAALMVTSAVLPAVAVHADAATSAPLPTCSAGRCTVTFSLTGTPQYFTVPAGVASLTATVAGGSGGGLGASPGPGGVVVARVPVTPGAVLTVVVGGRGADNPIRAVSSRAATAAAGATLRPLTRPAAVAAADRSCFAARRCCWPPAVAVESA